MAARCIYCDGDLDPDSIQYNAFELGLELNALIEMRIGRETRDDDKICQQCLTAITAMLDEPEEPVPEQHDINRCVACEVLLQNMHTHGLPEGPVYNNIAVHIFPRQVPENGRVCYRCWLAALRRVNRENQLDQNDHNHGREERIRLLQYRRTPNSAARCFVRGCINEERMIIPTHMKTRLMRENKLYVTQNARICREHLEIGDWSFLDDHEYIQLFTAAEIEEMMNFVNTETQEYSLLNFENIENMPEAECHYWLGLSKNQFLRLLTQVPQLVVAKPKNNKTALALFLIKLRTGEPNERLGLLFGFSEHKVRSLTKIARQYLEVQFVPLHLGVGHISKQNLIARSLVIPKGLYGDQTAITICDGTYIYLQKSSNYNFQKKTYSLHKYRNLIKPFLLVATDGHIIDVFGPYAATDSDAIIMKELFQNNQSIRNYYTGGDVFILDRGFRDAIAYLTSLNYTIYKPESLGVGETQLTALNANKSRCVTLCRWVVEVVNGRFKRDFKLFRNNYFNTAATHLMTDFKIAAAIINAYHPLIVDRPDASAILNRALSYLNEPNLLGEYIVQRQINRQRAIFVRINDANLPALHIFPQMSMSDLTLFTLGIYQIKQARSYYGEHIRENGSFDVEVCQIPEDLIIAPVIGLVQAQQLIRGRIKSRHRTSKIYYTYLLVNTEGSGWDQKLIGHYCSCIIGMRTVGCCAHVCTLVWYLGWARYQQDIEAPASFLDGILVRDDVENEGDSDSD